MSFRCEILERPLQRTLSIRTHTSIQDLPAQLGKNYGLIVQYLETIGKQPAGEPFAAYFNMDMQNLDVEMGFPVSQELPGKGEILSSAIPAGKFAACLYIGPYDQIEQGYTELTEFINTNKYQPTGIAYEFYIDDPQTIPPEQLRTQILFQLLG